MHKRLIHYYSFSFIFTGTRSCFLSVSVVNISLSCKPRWSGLSATLRDGTHRIASVKKYWAVCTAFQTNLLVHGTTCFQDSAIFVVLLWNVFSPKPVKISRQRSLCSYHPAPDSTESRRKCLLAVWSGTRPGRTYVQTQYALAMHKSSTEPWALC